MDQLAPTSCFARAPSCWRPATTTPPPCRWRRARELAPDKDSVREAYGRALFGAQRFARRPRSSRPSSSTRRPTTTRSSAWAARCSSSAATPRRATAGAGLQPAARSRGLPQVPRPGPPARRLRASARPERKAVGPAHGAILGIQLPCRGAVPGDVQGAGVSPLFHFERGGLMSRHPGRNREQARRARAGGRGAARGVAGRHRGALHRPSRRRHARAVRARHPRAARAASGTPSRSPRRAPSAR